MEQYKQSVHILRTSENITLPPRDSQVPDIWPTRRGAEDATYYDRDNVQFALKFVYSHTWLDIDAPPHLLYLQQEVCLLLQQIMRHIQNSDINLLMLPILNNNGYAVLDPLFDAITGKLRDQKGFADNMGTVTAAYLLLLSEAVYTLKDPTIVSLDFNRVSQVSDGQKDGRTTAFAKPLNALIKSSQLPSVETVHHFLRSSFMKLNTIEFRFIQTIFKDLLINQTFTRETHTSRDHKISSETSIPINGSVGRKEHLESSNAPTRGKMWATLCHNPNTGGNRMNTATPAQMPTPKSSSSSSTPSQQTRLHVTPVTTNSSRQDQSLSVGQQRPSVSSANSTASTSVRSNSDPPSHPLRPTPIVPTRPSTTIHNTVTDEDLHELGYFCFAIVLA